MCSCVYLEIDALQGALRRLALLAEKKPFALPGCNLIVAPINLGRANSVGSLVHFVIFANFVKLENLRRTSIQR